MAGSPLQLLGRAAHSTKVPADTSNLVGHGHLLVGGSVTGYGEFGTCMVPATAGGIYRFHTPLTSATPSRYRLIPHQSALLNLNWCIARLPYVIETSHLPIL